jgi:hypothetical protein
MRWIIFSSLLAGLVGCNSEVQLKNTPVSVAGKLTQSGRPVGGVMIVFQPLGDGHVREVPVQKDGSFTGELISGEYAYYVAKPTVPAAAQVVRKLPLKYFQADLARTITAEPGQQLAIALD